MSNSWVDIDSIALYGGLIGAKAIGRLVLARSVASENPYDLTTASPEILLDVPCGGVKIVRDRTQESRDESGVSGRVFRRVTIQPPSDESILQISGLYAFLHWQGQLYTGVLVEVDRKVNRYHLDIDEAQNVPIDLSGLFEEEVT